MLPGAGDPVLDGAYGDLEPEVTAAALAFIQRKCPAEALADVLAALNLTAVA